MTSVRQNAKLEPFLNTPSETKKVFSQTLMVEYPPVILKIKGFDYERKSPQIAVFEFFGHGGY